MSSQDGSKTLKLSPAGRRYMGFLAIFNTGDPIRIRAYIAENYIDETIAEHTLDGLVQWHFNLFRQTGGMRISRVFLSQEYYVVVIVETRNDGTRFLDKMKVAPDFPHKIIEFFHVPAEG